jgi:twitching motility protein PilT
MRLIPRSNRKGRVPAVEIMITTPFIQDCIMNPEKTKFIREAITQGVSQYGMQTFDQSLYFLYERGLINYEDALKWASNVDEFKLKKIGVQTTKDMATEEMEKRISDIADSGDEGSESESPRDHNLLNIDEL